MAKKPTQVAKTRDRITSAALECFMKLGPAGTTLVEVAKRAGLGPSAVHYHFPNSEALYHGIIEEVLRRFRSDVLKAFNQELADPAQILEDYVRSHFKVAKKDPKLFSVWLYFYFEASFSKSIRELNTAVRKAGRERIENILYRGVVRRSFSLPEDADLHKLSLEIQTILNGAWIMPFTESDCDFDLVSDLAIDRIFSMLGARAPSTLS